MEVWGAQGGSKLHAGDNQAGMYYGGYGGYSIGMIRIDSANNLYVNVGGKGSDIDYSVATSSGEFECNMANKGIYGTTPGGYNGGGDYIFTHKDAKTTGGGTTHIATTSGVLKNLSSNRSTILIVAGGGGGAGNRGWGGHGGGIQGVVPVLSERIGQSQFQISGAGTQTSGGSHASFLGQGTLSTDGSFGLGGTGAYRDYHSCHNSGNGGGGGWYGGGGNQGDVGGSGGGSGYIGSSDLISGGGITKHMTCYSCTTSTAAATYTISNTKVSATATADYSKTGNGYARITYLGTSI